MIVLSQFIKNKLIYLNLENNLISNYGLQYIWVLLDNKLILWLNISSNMIANEGLKFILSSLIKSDIEELNLG